MAGCVKCGSEAGMVSLVAGSVTVRRTIAGTTFLAQAAGDVCLSCGSEFASLETALSFEKAIATWFLENGTGDLEAVTFTAKVSGLAPKLQAEVVATKRVFLGMV